MDTTTNTNTDDIVTKEKPMPPPQRPTLEQLNYNHSRQIEATKIAALRSLAIQIANLNVQVMAMLHNLEQES